MTRLSVNVNKVATIRNSRGGSVPNVLQAVDVCLDAGAPGITVHPRADERHIRHSDVLEIADHLRTRDVKARGVEFNIEGDPRPDLVDLVLQTRPDQCTLVPVKQGEITSQAGWPPESSPATIAPVVATLKAAGVRVSVFIDPTADAVKWAAQTGADRVELYTEPYAKAFTAGAKEGHASFERYAEAARLAHGLKLGVNAGHDLDLDNLVLFRTLPHLDEVSIGHAIISRALWVGLDRVVREYLEILDGV
jgi:pyridoxine 5-phosphate synthase